MWTKEALHDLIQTKLRDYQLIVVANREPYIHRHVGKRIECMPPAGGMVTALGKHASSDEADELCWHDHGVGMTLVTWKAKR